MTKKTDGSEKPQPTEKENVKKIPDTLIPLKRKPDDDDKDDDSKVKKKTKLGKKITVMGHLQTTFKAWGGHEISILGVVHI